MKFLGCLKRVSRHLKVQGRDGVGCSPWASTDCPQTGTVLSESWGPETDFGKGRGGKEEGLTKRIRIKHRKNQGLPGWLRGLGERKNVRQKKKSGGRHPILDRQI